jgi:16S rRNA U516 pseudouridylate synthase RsuA-like enzyme
LLTYGKKRHIRRLMKAFGYKVKKLTRVKFWKYELWNLKPGKYKIFPIKWRWWKKLNVI